MSKTKEKVIIEKAPQVAFLSLAGCHVKPFKKSDGRVAFEVSGDVSGEFARLSSNPSVPILDYMNRLDAIRSVIFTMKGVAR
jgi:hypothetical protein